ncbi:MAG: cell division protein FtsZ [Candidatus Micrarchaeia archaeon]
MPDIDFDDFSVNIGIVGAGGMGTNLVNRIATAGIKSATTVAVNTDAKHLSMIKADKKILIGKDLTKGLGAGGYPELGAKAADVSREEIADAIKDFNLIFLSVGLGGGTGTGAAPIIAQIARDQGALVIGFATYPFSLERSRKNKADWGLEQLTKNADTTIIVENDRLLSYAPSLPLDKAFELIDNIASNAIRGIADTIKLPSLINVDFADLVSVVRDTKVSAISVGSGSGRDKINSVIKSTLMHPLLNFDYQGSKNAIVHVSGSSSMSIDEATKIGEGVTRDLGEDANVIFGARINPDLNDEVKVMSIITNVKPNFGAPIKLSEDDSSSDLSRNLDFI